jgi:hypothetical protein
LAEGESKGRLEVAATMKAAGVAPEVIAQTTGLLPGRIARL